MFSTIVFSVILIHLVIGFGYLIYKLSPTKKAQETNIDDGTQHTITKH